MIVPGTRTAQARPGTPDGTGHHPARLITVLFCLGLLLLSCRAAPPPRPDALLALRVLAPHPAIYVDEVPVRLPPGQESVKVAVSSGRHRVEVRAEGYFTAYEEVVVPPRGERLVQPVLRKDPDGDAGPPAPSPPAGTGKDRRAG